MKATEVTVQVFESKEELIKKLEANNFKFLGSSVMTDYYFSKYTTEELKKMTYAEIIKNSFIIRACGDHVSIVYKNKELDANGNVISETKTRFDIADSQKAKELFLNARLNNWCDLVQDIHCYKNDEMEILVQFVDGLGIFIEYEEDSAVAHLESGEKFECMVNKIKSLGLNLGEDYSVKKVYEKFIG